MRRLLEAFALIASLAIPGGWLAVFVLVNTPLEEVTRITMYSLFALSALVLTVGHVLLIERGEDGKASVWLVAFAYSKASLTTALFGVILVVILRIFGIDLSYIFGFPILESLALALVGGSAIGSMLAAGVFVYCYRTDQLDYRIYPWPWQAIKQLFARGEELG